MEIGGFGAGIDQQRPLVYYRWFSGGFSRKIPVDFCLQVLTDRVEFVAALASNICEPWGHFLFISTPKSAFWCQK